MDVRAARVDQLETVFDVLGDATNWLHSQGIEQWPERFDAATLLTPLQRGETWRERRGSSPGYEKPLRA